MSRRTGFGFGQAGEPLGLLTVRMGLELNELLQGETPSPLELGMFRD